MLANRIFSAVVTLILLAACSPVLFAQQTGELISIDNPATEDLYIAGRSIHILSEVDGDIVAAGQRIEVNQNVSGDIIAAAERISIRGTIGDDIRAVGRIVNVDGEVVGDTIVAGETVVVSTDSRIGGRLWAAGRSVQLDGRIEGELRAAAQQISISGNIAGDVFLIAQQIELLPGAQIQGNLTYRSDNEIFIAPGAKVTGTIERKALETPEATMVVTIPVVIGFFLSLIVSVSIIYWLFNGLTKVSSASVLRDPFKSVGVGLAVFLGLPVLAALLFISVVGLPIGFLLLALYPVLLFVGFAIGLYTLGTVVLRLLNREENVTRFWRLLSVVSALLVLTIAQYIPFAGGFFTLFVVLAGLGALSILIFQKSCSV